ncbi:nucleoside triphosphate pyrophosphatase [Maricaulis sp.]|uniref:Maf family protein n=1 Tax=Maricaulis sp. TaxID=1486257 RepID=UPI0026257636|nr:nucleoside triphosphate pyrophosphatase [Maricaulis sp.]
MSDLVLASGSQIRRQVLEGAGVPFSIIKPDVDEAVIKAERSGLAPVDMALELGKAKAESVSLSHPDKLVLGADQTMELEGRLLDKLPRPELARGRLEAMRGRPHHLHSGLALFRAGRPVWLYQQTSTLHVRDFSDAFLDMYLKNAGFALTASVGAYAYEGLGAQLFSKVEGDYYAILGLPLLPLLRILRDQGVIVS